jgi:integrase
VRVRLKGINTVTKRLTDGSSKVYHYHRATGIALEGRPNSAEFIASFAAAEATLKDRLKGVVNQLSREYTASPEFKMLAKSTKSEYVRMLKSAELEFGQMPIAALNDPRVKAEFLDWRDRLSKSSGDREADNRLSAVSAMLTWATDRGKIEANYVLGFKRLYHSNRRDLIWLPEHISAFMKVASVEMQRALILGLHSGQREGDLILLPWSAYDGKAISLRPGKEERKGVSARLRDIPCTRPLRTMLNSMERVSPLILTTKSGRAFKKRYFCRLWSEAMLVAGIETVRLPGINEPVRLHYHDLRGTAVTLLSEAGCTVQQIAAITGHSLETVTRILERYLKLTSGLAEQAIFNFENSKRTKFAMGLRVKQRRT